MPLDDLPKELTERPSLTTKVLITLAGAFVTGYLLGGALDLLRSLP